MHRTLKEDTTKPPALQQKKFDGFRKMFNHERPHEGLNNKTSGGIYQPSSMMLPRALIGHVYPKGFVIRRVGIRHKHVNTDLADAILTAVHDNRLPSDECSIVGCQK